MKLSEEQRQAIIQELKLDYSKKNIESICKQYNLTKQYVYKLAKKDVEQSIIANNEEFTKKANRIINLIFERIEKELTSDNNISLSQLSTTLGILYDKSRLENNLSTSNNSININIKIE